MMGPGHALTGAILGLAAGGATGQSLASTATLAGIGAGAALLPDIDNPSATVSRILGPASQWVSRRVNAMSALVYDATKTARDDDRDGGHRGVTHTWPFAAAVGIGTWLAAQHVIGAALVLFLCFSLALRGLLAGIARRLGWIATTAVSAGLTAAGVIWMPPAPQWVGVTVGAGSLLHCWGDSLTLLGCPWMWPLRIRGKRWYGIATPGFLRFRAGGDVERWAIMPVLTALTLGLTVTAIPGGWAWLDSIA